MSQGKIIKYPPYINTCALIIGKLRDVCNAELDERNPSYKRGTESVHVLGLKGELIAQHFAWERGMEYKSTMLLSSHPLQEPDIEISNNRYDVKTLPENRTDLLVNKVSHEKDKNVTHYWFIQILDEETARYWVFPYEAISNWPVKNAGYSDAYYLPISSLESEVVNA